MTTKLPPGSPPLTIDGKVYDTSDVLSDSEWEALPEDKGQQKQQNLGRIARKQKGKEK